MRNVTSIHSASHNVFVQDTSTCKVGSSRIPIVDNSLQLNHLNPMKHQERSGSMMLILVNLKRRFWHDQFSYSHEKKTKTKK